MLAQAISSAMGWRQSPENPNVPLDDPSVLDVFGLEPSLSGARINERTSLGFAPVWSAVRLLSESIAFLPWRTMRRGADGSRDQARDHPVWPILHDAANPELTAYELMELLTSHVLTWGNGYAEIERDGAGRPRALWAIRPDHVTVVRRDRQKFLWVQVPGKQAVRLAPGSYLHLRGLGHDGLIGFSPIRMHRETLGLGIAARDYGAMWFGKGGRVPMVIRHPAVLKPATIQKIRRQWEEVHGSLSQAHRVAILDEGMEAQKVGVPAQDSEYINAAKLSVTDVARIFRVPPHMLADLERSTFSNIEHQQIEYVIYSLSAAWLRRFEQSANRVLFTPAEQGVFFTKFAVDALLRGDSKTRAEALAVRRQNGIINADEWRELDDMNPQPDGQGQVYLVPLNMVPAQSLVEEGDDGEDEESVDGRTSRARLTRGIVEERNRLRDAFRPLFLRAVERILSAEVRALLRALREALKNDAPVERLVELMEDFWEQLPEQARRILGPVVVEFSRALQASIEAETGTEDIDVGRVESFALIYAERWGARHAGQSGGALANALSGVESIEDLEARVGELEESWTEGRPEAKAEENLVRSEGALGHLMYAMAGVAFLIWRNSSGACPLCQEWEGKTVAIDQPFGTAGDVVNPSDPDTQPLNVEGTVTHPPLHGGCNCHIVAG